MGEALAQCQRLRGDPRNMHVVISSELRDMVGLAGVAAVEAGHTPDGQAYDWSKAGRAGASRRNAQERQAIHYLANLLGLFTRTERVYRVSRDDEAQYQYLVDLVTAAAGAGPERAFLVSSHIGNFALYTAGICAEWVEHRHRYKHRPVTVEYYCKMGRSYYFTAARHPLASEFGLRDVYGELAGRFDYYRDGLAKMAGEYLPH